MRRLAAQAVERGAECVSFHEMCITGYSYLQDATAAELRAIAEPVPDGVCCHALVRLAADVGVPVLAGLVEIDGDRLYNTYVCATADGIAARHRKLHAFLNPHLSSGDAFTVFDLPFGRCAILICYDNNLPENVRCVALRGAEILFAPHVTGCAAGRVSADGLGDPKRSAVAAELWIRRDADPAPLRAALHGAASSGRGWLMRWLPSRAYDNALFVVFTNPIGLDDGQVRNGNAMVLDPFGEVVAECLTLGDGFCVALCAAGKRAVASGTRFLAARRPELYGPLAEAAAARAVPVSESGPGWTRRVPKDLAAGAKRKAPEPATVSGRASKSAATRAADGDVERPRPWKHVSRGVEFQFMDKVFKVAAIFDAMPAAPPAPNVRATVRAVNVQDEADSLVFFASEVEALYEHFAATGDWVEERAGQDSISGWAWPFPATLYHPGEP